MGNVLAKVLYFKVSLNIPKINIPQITFSWKTYLDTFTDLFGWFYCICSFYWFRDLRSDTNLSWHILQTKSLLKQFAWTPRFRISSGQKTGSIFFTFSVFCFHSTLREVSKVSLAAATEMIAGFVHKWREKSNVARKPWQ